MSVIKCPKCGETFKIDENSYAEIARQVRDAEFSADIEQKLHDAEEVLRAKSVAEYSKLKNEKEAEIVALKSEKEREIAELNAKISGFESERKIAVSEAVAKIQQERDEFKNKLNLTEAEKKLAVSEAVAKIEKERDDFKNKLELTEAENRSKTMIAEERYRDIVKLKDEEIAQLREFKAKQSTKMVGESLEQYCHDEFDKIRATAFPTAYFEKDNDAKTGSKGDFIFRENDADGTEIVSIMFEMKNEMDTTATKHRNEDFFKELDKDRR